MENKRASEKNIQRVQRILQAVVFPLILFLFPLMKINQGIDLTDTGYSLGNYRFFGQMDGVWMLLTFLANTAGAFLTKLPLGQTMLGMKLYTSLIVSLMALLGYRFFKTKMPAHLAFAGELAAIGFCWCPTVILYNYLTYFLFLLGAILLFRGLAGNRPVCLVLAGIVLGCNVWVRFPNNVLEASLIIGVWYYGALKKKSFQQILKETGLCVAGYLISFAGGLAVISALYGTGTLGDMITGVFGMAGSASDYTLGEMLLAILDAYLHGLKWMLYMILCILPGIPFLVIKEEKFLIIRKVLYCICIPLLFFVLGKWGMFNFKYYQKEAALQWGAVFLLAAFTVLLWMLFTRGADAQWRLIACIAFLMLFVTPLGSNNHIWPILNNLFFIVPIVFWMVYRFVRWGRTYLDASGKVPLFPVKAMTAGILIAFLVQSIGIGCAYVFLDGEGGEKRMYKVSDNPVLRGMRTSEMNAETLEEINAFMIENKSRFNNKKVILYGNIPGLAYYLDKEPAVYTTWPDLNTNSLVQLSEELTAVSQEIKTGDIERPLVVITPAIDAYFSGNDDAMVFWGTDRESYDQDQKLHAIWDFMEENAYRQTFANEAFVVYE